MIRRLLSFAGHSRARTRHSPSSVHAASAGRTSTPPRRPARSICCSQTPRATFTRDRSGPCSRSARSEVARWLPTSAGPLPNRIASPAARSRPPIASCRARRSSRCSRGSRAHRRRRYATSSSSSETRARRTARIAIAASSPRDCSTACGGSAHCARATSRRGGRRCSARRTRPGVRASRRPSSSSRVRRTPIARTASHGRKQNATRRRHPSDPSTCYAAGCSTRRLPLTTRRSCMRS